MIKVSLYKAKRWEKRRLLPEDSLQRTEAHEEGEKWDAAVWVLGA